MPHHDRPNVFLPRIGNITSGTLGVKSAIVSGPLRWRALTVALYSENLLLQPAKLNAMIPGLFRLFSVCVHHEGMFLETTCLDCRCHDRHLEHGN